MPVFFKNRSAANTQQLLAELRDKLCNGNAAELARRLGKDPTYVNRLFYPKEKAGHKGIGLEIMSAANRAFFLPPGFWDMPSPALEGKVLQAVQQKIARRNAIVHGLVDPPADPQELFEALGTMSMAEAESMVPAQGGVSVDTSSFPSDLFRPGTRALELGEVLTTEAKPPGWGAWAGDEVQFSRGPAVRKSKAASYGMEPILAWEHPDDLPEGEFVMVPRLDVHLSAGGGREQVEIDLVKENPQAFRSEWIRLMRLKPNKLAAMRATGDSMEPTIHDGDSLLVDTSQTAVVDGKVYALWYDGGERVKRLFRLPGGGLRIKSDNAEHGTIELGPDYPETVRIIGRVVHRSGVGGL